MATFTNGSNTKPVIETDMGRFTNTFNTQPVFETDMDTFTNIFNTQHVFETGMATFTNTFNTDWLTQLVRSLGNTQVLKSLESQLTLTLLCDRRTELKD